MALTLTQKIKVLNYLMPDCARLVMNGELVWLDPRPMPTESEMEAIHVDIDLLEAKRNKSRELHQRRDKELQQGMPWEFHGVPDKVQTREEDKFNLLALSQKSTLLRADGVTEAVLRFRALSNRDHYLTPEEMIAMTDAAFVYLHDIYTVSWTLKDAVEEATTVAAVKGIQWPDNSSPIPE